MTDRTVVSIGVDHGRQVPQNFEWGMLMQIVPHPDFVQWLQKGAFSGLQNTPKSVSGGSSVSDRARGTHDAPPRDHFYRIRQIFRPIIYSG